VAGNSGRPGLKASSKTAAILLALTTGGTALLGRRVRMCPLTTQVDGEEHAAKEAYSGPGKLISGLGVSQ
jgi:hypothetical protein